MTPSHTDNELERQINGAAWVVNWVCVILIFGGLILLDRQLDHTNQLRNIQISNLDHALDALLDASAKRDTQITELLRVLDVRAVCSGPSQ